MPLNNIIQNKSLLISYKKHDVVLILLLIAILTRRVVFVKFIKKNLTMKTLFTILLLITYIQTFSQIFSQIEYIYDEAGNRHIRKLIDMSDKTLGRNDSTSESDTTIIEERNELTYNFSADSKISVFPNPVKQTLNIQTENINTIDISVIDFSGKTLMNKKNSDSWNLLDLSMLPPGSYILSIIADGKKTDWKILKD